MDDPFDLGVQASASDPNFALGFDFASGFGFVDAENLLDAFIANQSRSPVAIE